jgi:hypothetical protein
LVCKERSKSCLPNLPELGPAEYHGEHRLLVRVKVASLQSLESLPSASRGDVGERQVLACSRPAAAVGVKRAARLRLEFRERLRLP